MLRSNSRLTLFSFGYYGWGNATPRLIEAVDAVERRRGFAPPIFVDTRIRRGVRARGFNGPAFERLLGTERHRWLRALGNERIIKRSGPLIQIAEPDAANDLLDLAVEAAREKRRLIFFCSCQWACLMGEPHCHRTEVATLVIAAARRRGVRVEVVEWPGGRRAHVKIDLPPDLFRSVSRGLVAIPLPEPVQLDELGGLPWGSVATFRHDGQEVHRLVGPAV